MVNIITFEGAESNIQVISRVPEMTGGQVQIVNGQNMLENVASMLNQNVIATQVELKVRLHKGLEFRNEDL